MMTTPGRHSFHFKGHVADFGFSPIAFNEIERTEISERIGRRWKDAK